MSVQRGDAEAGHAASGDVVHVFRRAVVRLAGPAAAQSCGCPARGHPARGRTWPGADKHPASTSDEQPQAQSPWRRGSAVLAGIERGERPFQLIRTPRPALRFFLSVVSSRCRRCSCGRPRSRSRARPSASARHPREDFQAVARLLLMITTHIFEFSTSSLQALLCCLRALLRGTLAASTRARTWQPSPRRRRSARPPPRPPGLLAAPLPRPAADRL